MGLTPARNEGAKIEFALKALAPHTDAINLRLKQQWYCWLERERDPRLPIEEILRRYANSEDEIGLLRESCPEDWLGD